MSPVVGVFTELSLPGSGDFRRQLSPNSATPVQLDPTAAAPLTTGA
jgi:hypothetical protein